MATHRRSGFTAATKNPTGGRRLYGNIRRQSFTARFKPPRMQRNLPRIHPQAARPTRQAARPTYQAARRSCRSWSCPLPRSNRPPHSAFKNSWRVRATLAFRQPPRNRRSPTSRRCTPRSTQACPQQSSGTKKKTHKQRFFKSFFPPRRTGSLRGESRRCPTRGRVWAEVLCRPRAPASPRRGSVPNNP